MTMKYIKLIVTGFQIPNGFEDLQYKQTNPLPVELKFRIETQKPLMTAEITELFIRQETVYGGAQGLTLYIKAQVIKLVYVFEDSGTYIKHITLTNMYASRKIKPYLWILNK